MINGRFALPLAMFLSSCFASPAPVNDRDKSPQKGSQSSNGEPGGDDPEDETMRSTYPDLHALFQKPAAKSFFSTSTQEILKIGQDVNSARAFLWRGGVEGYLEKNPDVCKSLSAVK